MLEPKHKVDPSRNRNTKAERLPAVSTQPEVESTVSIRYSVTEKKGNTQYMHILISDSSTGQATAAVISFKHTVVVNKLAHGKGKSSKSPGIELSLHDPETGEITKTLSPIPVNPKKPADAMTLENISLRSPKIISSLLRDTATKAGINLPQNLRPLFKSDPTIENQLSQHTPMRAGITPEGNLKVLISDSPAQIRSETFKVTSTGGVFRFVKDNQVEKIGQLESRRVVGSGDKISVEYLSENQSKNLDQIIAAHLNPPKPNTKVETPKKDPEAEIEPPQPQGRPAQPQLSRMDQIIQQYIGTLGEQEALQATNAIKTLRAAPAFQKLPEEKQLQFLNSFVQFTPEIRSQLMGFAQSQTLSLEPLLATDIRGKTTLENVQLLANSPQQWHREVAQSVLRDVITPVTSINQKGTPTCAATAIMFLLASHRPAEYSRMMTELVTTQKTVLPSGTVLVGPRDISQIPMLTGARHRSLTHGILTWTLENSKSRNGLSLNIVETDQLMEALSVRGYRQLDAGKFSRDQMMNQIGTCIANGYSVFTSINLTPVSRLHLQKGQPLLMSPPAQGQASAMHAVVVTGMNNQVVEFYNPWGMMQTMPTAKFARLLQQAIVPDMTAVGSNR